MPTEVTNTMSESIFRPPQDILDVFWKLSDGTDEERCGGVVKLTELIKKFEKDVQSQILKYSKERLIRGLSSGRKFARVGFSIALAQLLRDFGELQVTDILETMKDKLKLVRQEKKSKAEVGGIFLGRAFAFSAIIKSGRLSQLSGEELSSVVNELIKMSDKKSYLKAISNRCIENLIQQISSETFEEHVWPKIKVKLESGWESCTLDTISLLLTCRETFPKVTRKKFLQKHWGFPLFSEENDEKLMKAIVDTAQKSEVILEKIFPHILTDNRDIMSVWKNLGEKLMESLPDKRKEAMGQRHRVGLQLAAKLVASDLTVEQMTELISSPNLAKCLFHTSTKKGDILNSMTDSLFDQICAKLKTLKADILEVVEKIWKLESSLSSREKSGYVNLVNTPNFTKILDLMSSSEAEKYVRILSSTVKGKDKWLILVEKPDKQLKQVEYCLRQLQHIVCSPRHTTPQIQQSVLTLFLRLACFHVKKKTKTIEHCERCCNYILDESRQKVCESSFHKCLDTLSTLHSNHQSKWDQFSSYLSLMSHLVEYIQALLTSETVKPLKTLPAEIKEEWDKLFALVSEIKEEIKSEKKVSLSSAFLLLFSFLGIHMLADFNTSVELLKDVYICYERATKEKKKKAKDDEPHWVEVVTEVLLSLLSLQSHLGRVITTSVYRSMLGHLTPAAIGLISEVLIPKKTGADDAGGVLVDTGADEEDDEDDQEEEEEVEESSGEDDDKSDEEEEEDVEEDNEEIDETFRKSVKEALGKAAADSTTGADSDDEDRSDLSDSEMFKLDDMLAEVFRQKKLAGGKRARQEKRKETDNFRIRVLDLVEVIIKSERCGDFVLDLLKPILLLMMKTNPVESQVLCDKARSMFTLLKSKSKGQKDSVHSEEDQKNVFVELLELAQSMADPGHLQSVAAACFAVMNLNCSDETHKESSLPTHCVHLLKDLLQNVIDKKKAKPSLSFFLTLIDFDPMKFQVLAPDVLNCLKDESTRTHSKMICCSLLASLAKKSGGVQDSEEKKLKSWMTEAAVYIKKLILSLEKEGSKVKFTNNVLTLAVALQSRNDVFQQPPFDVAVSEKLQEFKSSFNTDLRRLANKVISNVERSQSKDKKKKEKRQSKDVEDSSASFEQTPAKKKRKL